MLRVRYERYWNDYHRKDEVKTFADLDELADWMFNQMQQDYTNQSAMSFPTPKEVASIGEAGPWTIEFRPVWGEEIIWVRLIESNDGIIFSDGRFTARQKHWSKAVQDWLIRCEQRRCQPKFNFAE